MLSATTFSTMHDNAYIDVFAAYIDQIVDYLGENFPTIFDFLITGFSSKTDEFKRLVSNSDGVLKVNSEFDKM